MNGSVIFILLSSWCVIFWLFRFLWHMWTNENMCLNTINIVIITVSLTTVKVNLFEHKCWRCRTRNNSIDLRVYTYSIYREREPTIHALLSNVALCTSSKLDPTRRVGPKRMRLDTILLVSQALSRKTFDQALEDPYLSESEACSLTQEIQGTLLHLSVEWRIDKILCWSNQNPRWWKIVATVYKHPTPSWVCLKI